MQKILNFILLPQFAGFNRNMEAEDQLSIFLIYVFDPNSLSQFSCPGGDARFSGGFGIFDAPEAWGPWTTLFYTEQWDVSPGETSSLPTKWMSTDGQTVYLFFSGDYSFSVRKGTL